METLGFSHQTHEQNILGFNNKYHRKNGLKIIRIISSVCEKGCKLPTVPSQISLSYLDKILAVAKTLDHPVTYLFPTLTTPKKKLKENKRLFKRELAI